MLVWVARLVGWEKLEKFCLDVFGVHQDLLVCLVCCVGYSGVNALHVSGEWNCCGALWFQHAKLWCRGVYFVVEKHKATPDMQLFQYHCDGFPDEKRFKGKKGVDLLLALLLLLLILEIKEKKFSIFIFIFHYCLKSIFLHNLASDSWDIKP